MDQSDCPWYRDGSIQTSSPDWGNAFFLSKRPKKELIKASKTFTKEGEQVPPELLDELKKRTLKK